MRIFFQQNVLRLLGLFICLILSGGILSEHINNGVVRPDIPLYGIATWMAEHSDQFHINSGSNTASAPLAMTLFFLSHALLSVVFMLIFWRLSAPKSRQKNTRIMLLLGFALVISLIQMSDLNYIVSVLFALLLPLRKALKCLALLLLSHPLAQVLLVWSGSIDYHAPELQLKLLARILELPVYLIFFAVAYAAKQERARRLELLAAHAELLATEMLLRDTVCAVERQDMARDVHDVLGHQLTALNLHLDLAQRQIDSAAADEVRTALATSQQLASTLLSQVRGVVSIERQDPSLDTNHD